jgi:hypothetical protein
VRAIVAGGLMSIVLIGCDAADPAPPSVVASSPGASVDAETPAFRFVVHARRIETTTRDPLGERARRAIGDAFDAVHRLVNDLYVKGFLDPDAWRAGDYDAVFDLFSGGARVAARERARALTAGTDAGERFTSIDPAGGGLWLRALVDRAGAANLVSSVVRFRARTHGDEPTLFRSEGTFLFRRTGDGWRIVAFRVVRRDRGRVT